MQTNGTKRRLATFTTVALLALAVVPALAASASAAAVPSSAHPASGASGEWAYGGQGWSAGGINAGTVSLTWNASAGAVVIYNSTNTSATTTELTAQRTVMVTVTASLSAPNESWAYSFKLLEVDRAYANLTSAAAVTLSNSTVVPALGILNASLHANVSLQASLVGTSGNKSMSDYLNASGWAHSQVAFAPALGLVPLNLTGVTGWTSSANASGSAAWNISWSFTDHGFNGTTASKSGYISGTWSTATEVLLTGHVVGPYAKWVDHRVRLGINLGLTGPFDLYAGVLLVPHGFDLLGGGAHAYAASGIGATAGVTENLYLFGTSHVSARAVTAANLNASASTPTAYLPAGAIAPAASSGASPSVWENPESVGAAQSQAYCFEFGCGGGSNRWAGLLVPLAIAGVAAAVIAGIVVSRRGRGGRAADLPLRAASSPMVAPPPGTSPPGPTPPTP